VTQLSRSKRCATTSLPLRTPMRQWPLRHCESSAQWHVRWWRRPPLPTMCVSSPASRGPPVVRSGRRLMPAALHCRQCRRCQQSEPSERVPLTARCSRSLWALWADGCGCLGRSNGVPLESLAVVCRAGATKYLATAAPQWLCKRNGVALRRSSLIVPQPAIVLPSLTLVSIDATVAAPLWGVPQSAHVACCMCTLTPLALGRWRWWRRSLSSYHSRYTMLHIYT